MAEEGTIGSGDRGGRARGIGAGVGLLALAASALYAGDVLGVRSAIQGPLIPTERVPADSRARGDPPANAAETVRVQSHPWWQDVGVLTGEGGSVTTVEIDAAALQWRADWSCTSGRFRVEVGGADRSLVDVACPQHAVAYGTRTGPLELEVTASGSWELALQQQVDVPLIEPPTAEMSAGDAVVVARGSFYDIDQTGRGEVLLYRLADGRHALRLDEFFVTPNVDLEVRLSPLEAPRTTEDYLAEEAVLVAGLDATAGSMNIFLPAGIDPAEYASVVIWCPPLTSAYAAASLVTA